MIKMYQKISLVIANSWYKKSIISYLLFPFACVFFLIVKLRYFLYKRGWKKVHKVSVPVIIVGNLTVGGTGKTPLVIWLANFLQNAGYKPGIITRGYGGTHTQSVFVSKDSNPSVVGDEALVMAKHTDCPIIVGTNRIFSARQLLANKGCNILLGDDGLQSYYFGRDVEIVVIDGERRFGNGFCLPAGPLREPISRLKQVAFIVTNGEAKIGEYTMRLLANSACMVNNPGIRKNLDDWVGQSVHVVAGIGNPQRFFNMLEKIGLRVIKHPFPDHYVFMQEDLDFKNYPIFMTEKDAVKCQQFAKDNCWFIPVKTEVESSFGENILRAIADIKKG